jgi:hypothetical protein
MTEAVPIHWIGFEAEKIPIRGEDGSWPKPNPHSRMVAEDLRIVIVIRRETAHVERHPQVGGTTDGKGDSTSSSRMRISNGSTILMDGNEYNIDTARRNGVRGVMLDRSNPQRLFHDILSLH